MNAVDDEGRIGLWLMGCGRLNVDLNRRNEFFAETWQVVVKGEKPKPSLILGIVGVEENIHGCGVAPGVVGEECRSILNCRTCCQLAKIILQGKTFRYPTSALIQLSKFHGCCSVCCCLLMVVWGRMEVKVVVPLTVKRVRFFWFGGGLAFYEVTTRRSFCSDTPCFGKVRTTYEGQADPYRPKN